MRKNNKKNFKHIITVAALALIISVSGMLNCSHSSAKYINWSLYYNSYTPSSEHVTSRSFTDTNTQKSIWGYVYSYNGKSTTKLYMFNNYTNKPLGTTIYGHSGGAVNYNLAGKGRSLNMYAGIYNYKDGASSPRGRFVY